MSEILDQYREIRQHYRELGMWDKADEYAVLIEKLEKELENR